MLAPDRKEADTLPTKDAEDLARRINEQDGWRAVMKAGGGGHAGGSYLVYGPDSDHSVVSFTANAKNPLHYWRAEAEIRRSGCPLPHKGHTPSKEDRMATTVSVTERRRSAELRLRLLAAVDESFGGDVAKLGEAAANIVDGSEFDQFGKKGAQTPPAEIAAESLRMFLEGRDWLEKNLERWEYVADKLGAGRNGTARGPLPASSLRGMVASALASMESRAHGDDPAVTAFAAFAKRAEQQADDVNETESVVALRRFLDGAEPDERLRTAWADLATHADAISTQVTGLVIARTAKHLEMERRLRGPAEELRRRLRERLGGLGAFDFSTNPRSPAAVARREFVESVAGWWLAHEPGLPQEVPAAMSWLAKFVQGDRLADEALIGAWSRALDGTQAAGSEPAAPEPEAEKDERQVIEVDLDPEAPLREELELAHEIEAELTKERDEARAEVASLKQMNENQATAIRAVNERAERAEKRAEELREALRLEVERSEAAAASVAELRAAAEALEARASAVEESAAGSLERIAELERVADLEAAEGVEVERLKAELAERDEVIRELKATVGSLESAARTAARPASLVRFREEYSETLLRLLDRDLGENDDRLQLLERLDKIAGLT